MILQIQITQYYSNWGRYFWEFKSRRNWACAPRNGMSNVNLPPELFPQNLSQSHLTPLDVLDPIVSGTQGDHHYSEKNSHRLPQTLKNKNQELWILYYHMWSHVRNKGQSERKLNDQNSDDRNIVVLSKGMVSLLYYGKGQAQDITEAKLASPRFSKGTFSSSLNIFVVF